MTIDTKRLKTDAAYWDSFNRPSATHYNERDGFVCTNTPKGSDIPRPAKPAAPEWDGKSMVEVGEWAEAFLQVESGRSQWKKVRVIGFWDGKAIVCDELETLGLVYHTSANFRPLRTKEQRDREELANLIQTECENCFPAVTRWQEVADAILSKYELKERNND